MRVWQAMKNLPRDLKGCKGKLVIYDQLMFGFYVLHFSF